MDHFEKKKSSAKADARAGRGGWRVQHFLTGHERSQVITSPFRWTKSNKIKNIIVLTYH